MRKLLLFLLLGILFFIFPQKIIASSITLSSTQTSLIAPDEEFVLDVNLSVSASDGTIYYLRGEFYQLITTNYCGFTWNGSGWYNGPYTTGEGWKNLLQISVQDNSWSGQLKAKIDLANSGCTSSGNYNFRVQRYTNSGSDSSDTETPLVVAVSVPTPSPTPTVAATTTAALTPTPTPTAVTTPTPTPTPTKKPTPKPTPTPVILGEQALDSGTNVDLAAARQELLPTPVSETQEGKNKFPFIAVVFVLLGAGLIGFSVFRLITSVKKGYTSGSET